MYNWCFYVAVTIVSLKRDKAEGAEVGWGRIKAQS